MSIEKNRLGVALGVLAFSLGVSAVGHTGDGHDHGPTTAASTSVIVLDEAPNTPLAKVGDTIITAHQVNQKAIMLAAQDKGAVYEIRKGALDAILDEMLLERESKVRKLSIPELLKLEVQPKPVTDEAGKAWFDENSQVVAGRTYDQVKGQIIEYLTMNETQGAHRAYMDKLRAKAAVEIKLVIPREVVPIADDDPVFGPASAPVTIVEFSDFECPFCSRVPPVMERIKAEYKDQIRVAFRDMPLEMHKNAMPAALAAQCAREQGKFWEYHDKVFANAKELDTESLRKYAKWVDLDVDKFNGCFDSAKYRASIERDMADAQVLGVKGTPHLFINGRTLQGPTFEQLKALIDEELKLVAKK